MGPRVSRGRARVLTSSEGPLRTIGIDLGGTKTLAVLVEDGVVVEKAKRPTPRAGSPDDVLATMAKVAASVDPDATATAIGIGAPGPVVPGTGVLPAAPNLPGWDHYVPVADLMSERLGGRPVVVGNDVNVGTLAEHRLGAGEGSPIFSGVRRHRGRGGAHPRRSTREGPRGLAGEIGHIFVAFRDLAQQVEGLGRGELEDYAGRKRSSAVSSCRCPRQRGNARAANRRPSQVESLGHGDRDERPARSSPRRPSGVGAGHGHGVRHHHSRHRTRRARWRFRRATR